MRIEYGPLNIPFVVFIIKCPSCCITEKEIIRFQYKQICVPCRQKGQTHPPSLYSIERVCVQTKNKRCVCLPITQTSVSIDRPISVNRISSTLTMIISAQSIQEPDQILKKKSSYDPHHPCLIVQSLEIV